MLRLHRFASLYGLFPYLVSLVKYLNKSAYAYHYSFSSLIFFLCTFFVCGNNIISNLGFNHTFYELITLLVIRCRIFRLTTCSTKLATNRAFPWLLFRLLFSCCTEVACVGVAKQCILICFNWFDQSGRSSQTVDRFSNFACFLPIFDRDSPLTEFSFRFLL